MVRLREGLTVLWRERGASQVGTDRRCRVVLEGLSDPEQVLLDHLAGSPTLADLVRTGDVLGVPGDRVRRIVATLETGGVLEPAAAPTPWTGPLGPGTSPQVDAAYWGRLTGRGWSIVTHRATVTAAVLGVDGLGMRIAAGLAAAGVGTVLTADEAPVLATDVGPGAFETHHLGRRREDAAAEVLRQTTPRVRTSAPAGTRPDVSVLVEHGVANPVRARPLVREDLPHLSVVVADVDVTVGPLVVPGRGPCLRCLDLHRCDDDPRWPAVATQVAACPPRGVESSLAWLGAALAVTQVLAHLDGREAAAHGATLEVDATNPVPRLTPRTPHPECGCHGLGVDAVVDGRAAAGAAGTGRSPAPASC